MTTAADLIAETEQHLLASTREERNKLDLDITDSASTLSTRYALGGINQGAVISVDLEIMTVWSVDTTTKTVTVERAQWGSTAAAHTAGALIQVNPTYPRFRILRALNEDLADLSSPSNGLYQVKTVEVTYNAAVSGYDLTGVTAMIGRPLEVTYQQAGPSKYFPEIRSYRYEPNMPTAQFASGRALFLAEGGYPGLPIHVTYRAPFGSLAALADDVQTATGLPATANDIPPMGAAIRLASPREIARNFTGAQPESRRAEEVPPGAVANSVRVLAGLREQRIAAEAARLIDDYPVLLPRYPRWA